MEQPRQSGGKNEIERKDKKWKFRLKEKSTGMLKEEHIKYFSQGKAYKNFSITRRDFTNSGIYLQIF